ncbi:hypothetical protein PG993_011564 [Apiospora rasikravindrae]|uniref:Uncharacterized protein n=1 Tax=Apiospora rasikravindrae TaxID=990691 RepID=A0ABR1S0F8_9PEZI
MQTFDRIRDLIRQDKVQHPNIRGSGRIRDKRLSRALAKFVQHDTSQGHEVNHHQKWKTIRSMGEALYELEREYGRGIIAVLPIFEMHRAMEGGELTRRITIKLTSAVKDLLTVSPVMVEFFKKASEVAGDALLMLIYRPDTTDMWKNNKKCIVRHGVQDLARQWLGLPEDRGVRIDSVYQRVLLTHSLSIGNIGWVMKPQYDGKAVDWAPETRNNAKAPREGLKAALYLLEPVYLLSRVIFLTEQEPAVEPRKENQTREYLLVRIYNGLTLANGENEFMYNVRRMKIAVEVYKHINYLISKDYEERPGRLPGQGKQADKRLSNAIDKFIKYDTGYSKESLQRDKWKIIRGMGEAINVLVKE